MRFLAPILYKCVYYSIAVVYMSQNAANMKYTSIHNISVAVPKISLRQFSEFQKYYIWTAF